MATGAPRGVVGRSVEELKLPPGTTIDAIVRGERVIIAHHDTRIEAGDHVILFLIDKKRISGSRTAVPGRNHVPVSAATGGSARQDMTRISAIQKIVGLLLALFSATMLPPIAVSPDLRGRVGRALRDRLPADPGSGSRAVGSRAQGPSRAQTPRRLSRRGHVLGRAGRIGKRAPAPRRTPRARARRRGVRVRIRTHHHRGHGDRRHRRIASFAPLLSPATAMAGRHGHHRARRRDSAHAGGGRHAALPCGDARSHQGREAHSAHHRNREGRSGTSTSR